MLPLELTARNRHARSNWMARAACLHFLGYWPVAESCCRLELYPGPSSQLKKWLSSAYVMSQVEGSLKRRLYWLRRSPRNSETCRDACRDWMCVGLAPLRPRTNAAVSVIERRRLHCAGINAAVDGLARACMRRYSASSAALDRYTFLRICYGRGRVPDSLECKEGLVGWKEMK
jgi:hypothetical protein